MIVRGESLSVFVSVSLNSGLQRYHGLPVYLATGVVRDESICCAEETDNDRSALTDSNTGTR